MAHVRNEQKCLRTSAAILKSIIQVAGDGWRVPAYLAIRESKILIRRGSRNLCKTDVLFAPQLWKQHEFVGQQMQRILCVCNFHFFNKREPRSMSV